MIQFGIFGAYLEKRFSLPLVLFVSLLPALDGYASQDKPATNFPAAQFRIMPFPSLRWGKFLRVDFRAKLQGDFRGLPREAKADEPFFDFRRARIGFQGDFLQYFEYEVEAELSDPEKRWRDVYINLRYFRDFQIQAGKFKEPFGRDQLNGPANLDFVFRSRIGSRLAPGRDMGVMAHGRFFNRGLNYQVGIFRGSGENAGSEGRTVAARVTGTPLRVLPVPGLFQSLDLGFSATSTWLPEKLSGMRGETVFGQAFFHPVNVNGKRFQLGIEGDWTAGPFSIRGEFIHARDQRLGQGVRTQDLPSLVARGWYVGATWALTGEKKTEGIRPHKNFLQNGGLGAFELAARYEQLRFGSSEHPGPPVAHPRAANILANSDRVWTSGINWYLNRYVKVQGNFIREQIEGFPPSPPAERRTFWTRVARLQFVL